MNFEQLYKIYWDKIFRLCLGYFNDYALAQDLTQDVFVRIWQYLPTFKGESSVGTWIFRIATNICLRQSERQKSISQTTIPFGTLEEESVDNFVQIQALYKTIAELPEIDRLIISLYLEEMKQSEISQIIGISETNVRVRIHRIKSTLAKKIKKNEE
ncbi:RNA polymerase sigma factor [Parabacteroides sp. APC149_11_2_Y6]